MNIEDRVITRKDMTFKEALDELDHLNVSKNDIFIYNKKMERVYL